MSELQRWLFSDVPTQPPPSPLKQREAAMKAAYDAADERWRVEFEAFILRYLSKHYDATAEEMRIAYEASGLPSTPNSKRASGKIFKELRKAGVIKEVGTRRSRLYGNFLVTYAKV